MAPGLDARSVRAVCPGSDLGPPQARKLSRMRPVASGPKISPEQERAPDPRDRLTAGSWRFEERFSRRGGSWAGEEARRLSHAVPPEINRAGPQGSAHGSPSCIKDPRLFPHLKDLHRSVNCTEVRGDGSCRVEPGSPCPMR